MTLPELSFVITANSKKWSLGVYKMQIGGVGFLKKALMFQKNEGSMKD